MPHSAVVCQFALARRFVALALVAALVWDVLFNGPIPPYFQPALAGGLQLFCSDCKQGPHKEASCKSLDVDGLQAQSCFTIRHRCLLLRSHPCLRSLSFAPFAVFRHHRSARICWRPPTLLLRLLARPTQGRIAQVPWCGRLAGAFMHPTAPSFAIIAIIITITIGRMPHWWLDRP